MRDDLTADDGRDQQPAHQRKEIQPGPGGRGPFDHLEVEREEGDGPEHGESEQHGDDAGRDEDLIPEEQQREDRLGRPPFGQQEAAQGDQADGPQTHDLGRSPRVGGATQAHHQHQRGQGQRQQTRAQVVDAVMRSGGHRRQGGGQHHQGQDTYGHIDVEDPPPREVGGQGPAEQWTDDGGQSEDRPEQPLVPAALTGRDDIPDGRLGADDEAATAQTLEGPEGDQLRKRVADAAEGRPDQEDHQADLEDDTAPELVAQLAVERSDHGLGQEIRRGDPRDVVQPAEVAGNGRQGGGHDGRVECRHQHDEHQSREDQGEVPTVELLGSVQFGQTHAPSRSVTVSGVRTRLPGWS